MNCVYGDISSAVRSNMLYIDIFVVLVLRVVIRVFGVNRLNVLNYLHRLVWTISHYLFIT